MIRQDYFLRMIREIFQVLARVTALREASDYDTALKELDDLFLKLHGGPVPEPAELEDWLLICRTGEGPVSERLVAVGDAWRERGELLNLEHRSVAAHHSFGLALGLYLERVSHGTVTFELLDRIGQCLAGTDGGPLPAAVLIRLAHYYESRGWLSRAEDVYFELLETGDPQAAAMGASFYKRLKEMGEVELKAGDLSPEEVEQGERDFRRRGLV